MFAWLKVESYLVIGCGDVIFNVYTGHYGSANVLYEFLLHHLSAGWQNMKLTTNPHHAGIKC